MKSPSKFGSNTSFRAAWTTRSAIVGIPSLPDIPTLASTSATVRPPTPGVFAPGWSGAVVVLRAGESPTPGEGRQRYREGKEAAMPKDAPVKRRARVRQSRRHEHPARGNRDRDPRVRRDSSPGMNRVVALRTD